MMLTPNVNKAKPSFNYPYDPQDGREDTKEGRDVMCILRGGSYDNNRGGARCALRGGLAINYSLKNLGFRVALSLTGKTEI